MKNIVCLYWAPGSCGDLIQHLLIATNQFRGLAKEYVLEASGRTKPVSDDRITTLFPSVKGYWFNRTWTEQDLDSVRTLANEKPFIIGTHQQSQLEFLRRNLGSDITTMGVTYNKSLFPLVVKNFCKKIAPHNKNILDLLTTDKNVKLIDYMIKNKTLGEYFLDQQLKYFNFEIPIPEYNIQPYDIAIELEDLYNNNVQSLTNVLTDESLTIFNSWYTRQDNLYKFKFHHNQPYIDCVGYNHKATTIPDEDLKFSTMDHILIKHYFLKHNITHSIPKTNIELVKIFENTH